MRYVPAERPAGLRHGAVSKLIGRVATLPARKGIRQLVHGPLIRDLPGPLQQLFPVPVVHGQVYGPGRGVLLQRPGQDILRTGELRLIVFRFSSPRTQYARQGRFQSSAM